MRLSDNALLATRRARVAAAALAVLALLIGVAVLVADSPDKESTLRAADSGATTTSTTAAAVEPAPAESTTTTVAPTTTTVPKRSTTTTTAQPASPPTPSQAYCGGWGGPGGPEDETPEGLVVTLTASAASVKRGDEITFTLRAKNTTSEPMTHQRSAHSNPITVHIGTDVVWMRTSKQAAPAVVVTQTFEPGEEKVNTVTWRTDQVCAEEGAVYKSVELQPGRYTVEASWNGGGYWPADPVDFEITP